MENSVKWRGRANVVVYENNDVDVRIPEENENLKHEKLKETKNGSLVRTQGQTPLLQLRVKTRADSPDPASDLRAEVTRLLAEIDKDDAKSLKIETQQKGRWLARGKDLKIRADTEKVIFQFTLPIGYDYELIQRLTSKISEIHQCLVTQRAYLSPLVNATK